MELNNMLLNNEWIKNEIKEEIKRYLETNENEDNNPKSVGHWESNLKGKFIALQVYLKKTRKISNKLSNFTLKGT